MLTGKKLEATEVSLQHHIFHTLNMTQAEQDVQRKATQEKLKAAIEEFRQHLEYTYLPQGNQNAKDALWSYIWKKRSEHDEIRTLRYNEMEIIYAEVATIVNLA